MKSHQLRMVKRNEIKTDTCMGETTLSELLTETGQMERNGAIIDGKQPH